MFKNLVYLWFTIVVFTFIGCGDDPVDPCAGVECGTNSTCISGTCECEDGYSGVNCEIFDSCLDVNCGDNATCVEGVCECADAYFGENCDKLIQDLFIGTWSGLDCQVENYSIEIVSGLSLTDLIIKINSIELEALIESETRFLLPTQTFIEPILQIEFTASGEGVLLGDGTLSYSESVSSDLGGGSCTILMTKQ